MAKKYKIEQSPFYKTISKTRTNLEVIEAGNQADLVIARKRHFKQDEYVKLIITDVLDINEYDKLSPTAKTVLFYIVYNCLEYNTPVFRFIVSTFITVTRKEESLVYKALKELTTNNYIKRTSTRQVYWINHNRFYKGNFIIDKYLKEK